MNNRFTFPIGSATRISFVLLVFVLFGWGRVWAQCAGEMTASVQSYDYTGGIYTVNFSPRTTSSTNVFVTDPASISAETAAALATNTTGGVAPYSNLWNSGATTNSIATAALTTSPTININNITTNNLSGTFRIQGGQPQSSGGNYSSVSMALFNNPTVTATLTTAPFTHNETVSFTVPQSGAYVVTVTDGAGCTGTAMITPVTCNPANDSLELVNLYNATNGPGWTNKTNWLVPGTSISTWHGVTVNGEGCVVAIGLISNHLNGILPDLNLPGLQSLSLSSNQLSGSIPDFHNIPNLESLVLQDNLLTGSIPDFQYLPNLEDLYCPQNQLSGNIPDFHYLPKLIILSCPNNQLSGNIPDFQHLPNLQGFWCYENNLSGNIPNFQHLPLLQHFWCNNNQLSGNIPNFQNLTALRVLRFDYNHLNGSIPNFQMPDLRRLTIRNNNFSFAPQFTQMLILGNGTFNDDSLTLQYNRLTFDDILPNMPLINGFYNNQATYAPQDSIYSDTLITRAAGQALTIDLGIDAAVPNNIYQWYKNGQPWTPPVGNNSNSNKLIFNNLQNTDAGIYHAQVTNPDAPALTLYSRAITLNIAANTCSTVNTTADSGPGSLREAINCANTNPGPDTIRFNIPGAGPHVINIATPLPEIMDSHTFMDGKSQPGWTPGTIIIDGSTMSIYQVMLYCNVDSLTFQGLVFRYGTGRGLALQNVHGFSIRECVFYGNGRMDPIPQSSNLQLWNCHNGAVQNCRFGITEANILSTTPTGYGITASGTNIRIGGSRQTQEGNVFGGHTVTAIGVWADGAINLVSQNIQVLGNFIGTDATETMNWGNNAAFDFGNNGTGLHLGQVWIGQNDADHRNTIRFNTHINTQYGTEAKRVAYGRNEFSCNNNTFQFCTCTPPHEVAIHPIAVGAAISGTAVPGDTVAIYISDETACPGVPCQGKIYLGKGIADNAGNWSIMPPFAATVALGTSVTAIGTGNGISGGFAACITAAAFICNQASDSLELVKLYNATNGPGWTNPWNLNTPMGTWFGIQLTPEGCVRRIDLSNNGLVGTLPNLDLPNLQVLDLDNNQISGNIPDFDLPSLLILDLDNNSFTGNIPNFDLPLLQYLSLSVNQLSGNLPAFDQVPLLQTLFLFQNNLEGTIPNYNLPLLTKFQLDDNTLSGAIPTFSGMPLIQYLHMDDNQLSGPIPNFNLPNLISLHLDKNALIGSIPALNAPNLQEIILNNNQLSGCFSPALNIYCSKIYNFSNNPLLPWQGDFQRFCNGENPIGAACNDNNPNTTNDIIQSDCQCSGTLTASTCSTVTTTADSGPGSLREAINCANNNPGPDTIRFNIPGAGPHVIAPLSNYADITGNNTVIDATTQPGWTLGNIVLDGVNLSNNQEPILRVWPASGSVTSPNRGFELYGITIKNVPGNGLNITYARDFIIGAPGKENVIYETGRLVSNGATGIQIWRCVNGVIKNNILGADQNLTPAVNRSGVGVAIWADSMLISDNIVKSPANGIVTLWYGPYPDYNYPDNITIVKNNISLCDNGILINDYSSAIRIGSDNATDENIIWNNSAGILVDTTNNQTLIARNQFTCNSSGISYKEASARPALPVIVNARTNFISGTATPNATVRVFINNATGCPTANCQGSQYVGMAISDNNGNWFLNSPFANGLSEGNNITATSTTQGITSEFTACVPVLAAACNLSTERAALEALYNATNGDNWNTKSNWKTAAPVSQWYGIQVNSNGCVQCIDMDGGASFCSLDGLIGNNLTGTIPVEIGQLSQLTSLNLNYNSIEGSIPAEIGNLPLLETLVLDNNKLTGFIPNSLFQLSKLQVLGLNSNQLEGAISPLIGNLSMLKILSLGSNKLSGPIPPQLGNLLSLRQAFLNFNQFSGGIPGSIAQISNLNTLFVSNNKFTQAPNLSFLPFKKDSTNNPIYFAGLRMGHNAFTFDDILPNISPLLQITSNNEIRYAPQDSILSDTTITRTVGQLLTIDLGIDAGIATNVYQWYKNGQLWQTVTGDNTWTFASLLPSDAGEYWVHVTNPGAPLLTLYSRKIRLNVSDCTVPVAPAISGPTALCSGNTVLTAAGFSQYNWSNGLTTASILIGAGGTYSVTVTDSNGCTGSATYTVGTTSTPLVVAPNTTATRCDSPTGAIHLNISSGIAPYTYLWSDNNTTSGISNLPAGIFTVTITDGNGCTTTASTEVPLFSIPPFNIVTSGSTTLCAGDSLLLSSPPLSDATYQWQRDGLDIPGATNSIFTNKQAGLFQLQVTQYGCTASSPGLNITVLESPVIDSMAIVPSTCGNAVGSVILFVAPANGVLNYQWSSNQTTATVNNLNAGTYTVTISLANGCSVMATANITDSDSPQPTIIGPDALVPGSVIQISLAQNYDQYLWSNGETTSAIEVKTPGTYAVTVTTDEGCTGTASKKIESDLDDF